MTINTSRQAMAVARNQHTNVPGMCQQNVHDWFKAPSVGDVDHDGDADAVDGWRSEPIKARHPGDRNPPPGKPLSFHGGSHGNGHRAMSMIHGVQSTDMLDNHYAPGHTSLVTGRTISDAIAVIEQQMNQVYDGWSDTISGIPIPPGKKPKPLTRGWRVEKAEKLIKRAQAKPGTARAKMLARIAALLGRVPKH